MFMVRRVVTQQQIERTAETAECIWRECYMHLLSKAQIDYMLAKMQSAEAIAADIADKGYEYYTVLCDGAEMGYMALQPQGDDLFLSKLYLLDVARGKGLGRDCVRYALEKAREKGCKRITLTVNRGNERAVARYKSYGFRVYDTRVTDIGGGFAMDDYFMEKSAE